MARLIHTGSVIIDQVMIVPHMPDAGGDVVASEAQTLVGGGFNTIVAAHRDGMEVLYAGLIGTGPNADLVTRALEEIAVKIALTPTEEKDTGYCVAIVDNQAERTFFTYVGAEGLQSYEHLSSLAVNEDDLVYVTGYSMADSVNADALSRWLPQISGRTRILVDPSPLIGELPDEDVAVLLKYATIFSCNARETRILGGSDDFDAAVGTLRQQLPPDCVLIARDGARGAFVSCSITDSGQWVESFAVEAVDTSGAGDAHAGVMAASIARGNDIISSVRRANAAAALAVTVQGPATSPSSVVIDEFLSNCDHSK